MASLRLKTWYGLGPLYVYEELTHNETRMPECAQHPGNGVSLDLSGIQNTCISDQSPDVFSDPHLWREVYSLVMNVNGRKVLSADLDWVVPDYPGS